MNPIRVLQVNQDLTGGNEENKIFYMGKILFSDLKKMVELEKRKYSSGGEAEGIQRNFDDKRRLPDISKLKSIKDFVSDKNLDIPYFISPIIFGFQSKEGKNYYDESKKQIFFDGEDLEEPIIVDGQHRYYGMLQRWEEDNNFNIELPIVFLIDYDKYQLSKVFANINFTQKPVNKSLFYDLFGSMPGDYNELNLAHLMVHKLNFYESSNLKNSIKMLGSGEGFISQAFLVEKLHKYFFNNSVLNKETKKLLERYTETSEEIKEKNINKVERLEKLSELQDDFKNEKLFHQYFKVLNLYFDYINREIGDNAKNTIGYGAFIRLLKDFSENFENFLEDHEEILYAYLWEKRQILIEKVSEDWGSSESAQNNLYKKILEIVFKNRYQTSRDIIERVFNDNYSFDEEIKLIDIYEETLPVLKNQFPNNKNLPAKVRQILQLLRDEGKIGFLGGGKYKKLK